MARRGPPTGVLRILGVLKGVLGSTGHARYCKADYFRLFAARCAGCNKQLEEGKSYQNALGKKWHPEGCLVRLRLLAWLRCLRRPVCI